MADYSFDYKESGMMKPVNFENLQDRKNFTDLYESVSSSRSNPGVNDVNTEKYLKKENSENALDVPSKSRAAEEEKPVSSKKKKSVNSNKKTKAVNSRALREKLAELSLSETQGRGIPGKSSDKVNLISDMAEQLIVPDQDIRRIDKADSADNAVNSSKTRAITDYHHSPLEK